MSLIAMSVFAVSLVAIILLFVLKRVEVTRGARFGESVRLRADEGAREVKHLFEVTENYLEHAPLYAGALTRYSIHVAALSFARVARVAAREAHRLADFVSHKRNFEHRATKSPFLKEVGEYKNGNGGTKTDSQV